MSDPSTGGGSPRVAIRNLGRSFRLQDGRTVEALSSIGLDIADGEFVCIIGASGSGKTTLLRILGGFDQASSGYVDIRQSGDERAIPPTATVFQEDSIFPWLTTRQNVEYGLRIRGVAASVRAPIVDAMLEKVGLTAFANAMPAQLSGGMRQRVSVARAFAAGSGVLLMDEPFGALDEQTRLVLQGELQALWANDHRTIVFVTHSLDEAIALADRIVVLGSHPGRIEAVIPVDIPRPRDVVALRSDPVYGELYARLWSHLRDNIAGAR